MTRFRKCIGEQGVEQLLKLSIDAGLKTGTIKPAAQWCIGGPGLQGLEPQLSVFPCTHHRWEMRQGQSP